MTSDVMLACCYMYVLSFQFYVCDYDNKGVRAWWSRSVISPCYKQHAATAVTVKLYWIRRFDLEKGEDSQYSSLDVKTTSVKWVFCLATSSSLNIVNCWRVDVDQHVPSKPSSRHHNWTVYFKSRTNTISQGCSNVTVSQKNFYLESRTVGSQQSSNKIM